MNFRLSAILFGVIFVLGAILLILSFTGDDKPPTNTLLEELAGAKADEIDTIEFERGNDRLKIVRAAPKAARWDVVEPYAARADAALVGEVINALRGAKPVAFPEISSDPAAHGLQPPGLRVVLRSGDKSSSINFGDASVGETGGVVFVTTSARPKRPMAVSRSAVEPLLQKSTLVGKTGDLAKWVNDYRAKGVFAADTRGMGDDVAAVTLTHGKNTLALESGAAGWKFISPAGWGSADSLGDVAATPGTFTGVNRLLGTLTNIQAQSADDFLPQATPQDLERYGVSDNSPGVVKVEIKKKDGETTVAFIGKKDQPAAPTPPVPGTPDSGKWWVRVAGQPGAIRAQAADLDGLAAIVDNPDPLRDRTLLEVDRLRVDGIDLANGATRLRKSGTPATWKLYGKPEYGDPQAAANVDRVLDVFLERRTVKSFPAPNPANFSPAELKATVKVWADGFEIPTDPKADPKAEPKEKGKPIVLEFGKKEADGTIHVRRTLADGTQAYFLLPEKVKAGTAIEPVDLLAVANRSRLELLDNSLKGFAATVAKKVTAAGSVNFEVARDEKPDASARGPQWKFVMPDNQKGQTADASVVDDILAALANTQAAVRLVDENPDTAKLATYGLAPAARLKVTVDLGDANDKERVYEFGNPLPGDANLVYARQAGRPVVFALPKALVDKFSGDLRDKAIFRFDPTQVTRVNLKGWRGATGGVQDLEFEKNKDGVWAVAKTTIPGYAVDPAKVTAFLNVLSNARVKEFVNGPPTAAMGFGDPKESLNVHLVIKDHPGIILDVWSPTDGGASYFAGVSVRPPTDPVVKLDAAALKVYKDSPAGFAK